MTSRSPSLLLAYDFPPLRGGIARALGEIARHAPAGELLVSTGTLPGAGAGDLEGGAWVDRLTVPSPRLRTLPGLARWALRAGNLARRHQVGFTWAGNLKPAGHVARWLRFRQGIPYGLIVYGLDVALLQDQVAASWTKRRLARGILAGAAGTVAISQWTADRFRELARSLGLPGAESGVEVIRPGVDTRRFSPDCPTEPLRQRLALGDRRWLLTVARLVPHKGIDLGIEVLAGLRGRGLDVGYLIAGEGPARAALERHAQALGVQDAVRWCGHVTEADLPALYAVAEVYLGLSRPVGPAVEGFGLSLLEAQAAGRPVVAGQGGGTGDAVAHGVTGYLVAPDQAESALGAVTELLQDPSRARVMGAAGRARMVREFGWDRVARDFTRAAEAFSAGRAGRAGR